MAKDPNESHGPAHEGQTEGEGEGETEVTERQK